MKQLIAKIIKNNCVCNAMIRGVQNTFVLFGKFFYEIQNVTYSQNCEDIILDRLCTDNGTNNGFYVDIGAHHPIRFSNTYMLHKKGWRGINVDPLPEVMELFKKERPEDINLNVGVSDIKGNLSYWMFEEPAYNTMDATRAQHVINEQYSPLKEKISVPVLSLSEIFDRYLPDNKKIDILDIDVEDYEIHVLKSNDWNIYRPRIVLIECYVDGSGDMRQVYSDEAVAYLVEQNYRVVAKVFNGTFMMDNLVEL